MHAISIYLAENSLKILKEQLSKLIGMHSPILEASSRLRY